MYLVVHQVVELQEVHVTHGHFVMEGFTGPPVKQRHLPGMESPRHAKGVPNLLLVGTVEDGNGSMDSVLQLLAQGNQLLVVQIVQKFIKLALYEDDLSCSVSRTVFVRSTSWPRVPSISRDAPAQGSGIEDLDRIHSGRNAQDEDHVERPSHPR